MRRAFGIFEIVEDALARNIQAVRDRIQKAAGRAARNAENIKLVAVSKTHAPETIKAALSSGLHVFGENKVQEADGKIADVGREAAEWHLIGHLQSNKARKAVQLFDVIQSIDSLDLARRLERLCEEEERESMSIFVQVDLAGERTKSGISETEIPGLVEYLHSCERLKLNGLMVLPPFFDDAEKVRPYFERLRMIRDELAAAEAFAIGIGELSMGMSHDFEIAIEEGATVVRVGTAIFGERASKQESGG
jgi:pyridoxal phosphate enzyme (YggS family)